MSETDRASFEGGELRVLDEADRVLWGRIPRPETKPEQLAFERRAWGIGEAIRNAALDCPTPPTDADVERICALIEGAAGAMRGEGK